MYVVLLVHVTYYYYWKCMDTKSNLMLDRWVNTVRERMYLYIFYILWKVYKFEIRNNSVSHITTHGKSLKIPEWKSQPVNQRTDNGQKKRQKGKNNNLTGREVWRAFGCTGRLRSSCSIGGICRVAFITNPVIRLEWGN